ncbi:MAG: hypothetical protein Q7S37_04890 [bacterium]|nr:hypothetical protein [bacterium]
MLMDKLDIAQFLEKRLSEASLKVTILALLVVGGIFGITCSANAGHILIALMLLAANIVVGFWLLIRFPLTLHDRDNCIVRLVYHRRSHYFYVADGTPCYLDVLGLSMKLLIVADMFLHQVATKEYRLDDNFTHTTTSLGVEFTLSKIAKENLGNTMEQLLTRYRGSNNASLTADQLPEHGNRIVVAVKANPYLLLGDDGTLEDLRNRIYDQTGYEVVGIQAIQRHEQRPGKPEEPIVIPELAIATLNEPPSAR